MSKTPRSLTDVMEALCLVYSDAGAVVYLEYAHNAFGGRRPIELCLTPEGRAQVYEHVMGLAK